MKSGTMAAMSTTISPAIALAEKSNSDHTDVFTGFLAAGETCAAGKDKTWIVDLDEEYIPYQDDMMKMMFECEPYCRNIAELAKVFFNSSHAGTEQSIFLAHKQIKDATPIIPTKHGKHRGLLPGGSHSKGGVPLHVHIYAQNLIAPERETGHQCLRGRALSYAALLVDD